MILENYLREISNNKISSFTIKKATLDDLYNIQFLNKKLFDYENDPNNNSNWSFSKDGKSEIKESISSKDSCAFILKNNDQTIGYLIGKIITGETWRWSRYSELAHMFVDEKYRGLNGGESLVKEFKQWSLSKGVNIISVVVSYNNKNSINFYKKMGLSPIDITMYSKL